MHAELLPQGRSHLSLSDVIVIELRPKSIRNLSKGEFASGLLALNSHQQWAPLAARGTKPSGDNRAPRHEKQEADVERLN